MLFYILFLIPAPKQPVTHFILPLKQLTDVPQFSEFLTDTVLYV